MREAAGLLKHAAGVVTRRRPERGEPADLVRAIARRWSLVLGVEVSPAPAVLRMLDVKMARRTRAPRHADSIADVAGYGGVVWEATRDG